MVGGEGRKGVKIIIFVSGCDLITKQRPIRPIAAHAHKNFGLVANCFGVHLLMVNDL